MSVTSNTPAALVRDRRMAVTAAAAVVARGAGLGGYYNGGAPDNNFANAATQRVDTLSGTAYGPYPGGNGGAYQNWGNSAGYGAGGGGGGSTGASWTTQSGPGGQGLLVLIWNPQKIYTLGAPKGTFGLTGAALTLKLVANLSLAAGVFAEAGSSGQTKLGRKLPVPTGALALSGRSLSPKTARKLGPRKAA